MKKTIVVLAGACAPLLWLAAPSHAFAAESKTVKIGAIFSITGPASFLGDPELRTLQMYVEELNAKGGVLGRKIELVHYDTVGQAKEAVTFVKRLIQNDDVDVIVGGSSTGDTMAAIPEVEKAGVPFISLAGGVEIIEPVKKWVFKPKSTLCLGEKEGIYITLSVQTEYPSPSPGIARNTKISR